MPEFVEAEAFRRTLDPLLGATINNSEILDERLLRRSSDDSDFVHQVLNDSIVEAARRIGKVVLLDLSSGHTAALGFGLRGRLVVDGRMATPSGQWRDVSVRPDHIRLALNADRGGTRMRMMLEDQLRLATLDIDIDERRLGIDVMQLDVRAFRTLIAGSDAAIKSLIMDQRRIAGIGNLIADEVLFQAGVDPTRRASSLAPAEVEALWIAVRRTRTRVLERGGSHQGVMIQQDARRRGAVCPRCDVAIERITVGGRTTYSCPSHQV